ncbi:MAG: glucose 1-dehydrogenase [Chloroflexota bacterium]|nr:glucose 1-dehydrogenase [Chloroflexota bacterium]MDE2911180.1 glucose 1-dehydrogenase [Chloroflexota bacterium]
MADLFDLNGRVAIVTGASRGIGKAIAEAFASAGAKVALASRRQDALDKAADAIRAAGGEAIGIAAHNGDKIALQALVDQTLDQFGALDILVNNAATNPHFGATLEAADSFWQKTIEVNLMGNVWLSQAAVPAMRRSGGGKIINIASIVGLNPGRFQGIYSATKAGVISLTKSLAFELGPDNIQVNAIAPGLVQTKFARALWDNPELLDPVLARTPAGRIGQPADISGIALYLASPASGFTTGAVFVLDGGVSALTL